MSEKVALALMPRTNQQSPGKKANSIEKLTKPSRIGTLFVAATTSTTPAVLEGLSDDVDDDVVIDVTEKVDDRLGEVVDAPPAPTVMVRVTVLTGKVIVLAGRLTVVSAHVGAAGGPQRHEDRGHPSPPPPP